MTDRHERPTAPSTPRDVVHIRLGSFVLVFLVAIGVLGFVSGATWLLVVAGVLALVTIADIVLAIQRQGTRERQGDGSAGFE
ncbi:hypothetical protein [Streptosporangium sp. KLBMP 9127]|nr:hypothetical protein [Streptosporangium sp. KLBMP 9127]